MKNFKLPNFITSLIIALAYPLIKYATATSNKMTILSDTMLIIGLILIPVGIIYRLYLKGDFANSFYMLTSAFIKKNKIKYDKFMADDKQKREDSFNYPLLTSLVLIALSYIIALIFS